MTKADLFYKYENLLESDNLNTLLHYLFDYFSMEELKELLEHIKTEKGLENDE